MTTYQDPLPQSRRAVREQNERESAQAAVVPTTGPTPTPVAPEAPAEPLTYTTQGRVPVPNYDAPAMRVRRTPGPAGEVPADDTEAEGYRPRDFSPEGRRSAAPTWAPQYGGAPSAAEPPADVHAPKLDEAGDIEAIEHTLTRRELRALRDAHGITAQTTGETAYPTPAPTPVDAAPAAPVAAPAEPVAPAPAPVEASAPAPAPAPTDPGTPLVAPSTRLDSALAEFDQLAGTRAPAAPTSPPAPHGRRAAAPAGNPAAITGSISIVPDVATAVAPVEPTPVADEAPAVEEAAVEVPAVEVPAFDDLLAPVADAPVAEAPAAEVPVAETPAVEVPVADAPPAPIPLVEPPIASAPQPEAAWPAAPQIVPDPPVAVPDPPQAAPEPQPEPPAPEIVVAEIIAQPVAPEPVASAEPIAPEVPVVEATIVEATIVDDEPAAAAPPTGHWTTQAQLDDETQFGDASLSRNIGATSGAITTSALVLPSIPNHDFGPLPSGDVMVTGSISLPESLAATGAHPAQLDEHALDHLLDPGDHQVASTDSQPVRAIKAVSGHTGSGGVIQNVKPKGNRGLTALIIAATSMAVVVGALFIVLVVTGQLG